MIRVEAGKFGETLARNGDGNTELNYVISISEYILNKLHINV